MFTLIKPDYELKHELFFPMWMGCFAALLMRYSARMLLSASSTPFSLIFLFPDVTTKSLFLFLALCPLLLSCCFGKKGPREGGREEGENLSILFHLQICLRLKGGGKDEGKERAAHAKFFSENRGRNDGRGGFLTRSSFIPRNGKCTSQKNRKGKKMHSYFVLPLNR